MAKSDVKKLMADLCKAHDDAEEYIKTPAGKAQKRRFDFGNYIANILRERSMSQLDLCNLTKIKPSMMSQILCGERNYTIMTKTKILCALDIEDEVLEVPDERSMQDSGTDDIFGTEITTDTQEISVNSDGQSHNLIDIRKYLPDEYLPKPKRRVRYGQ